MASAQMYTMLPRSTPAICDAFFADLGNVCQRNIEFPVNIGPCRVGHLRDCIVIAISREFGLCPGHVVPVLNDEVSPNGSRVRNPANAGIDHA